MMHLSYRLAVFFYIRSAKRDELEPGATQTKLDAAAAGVKRESEETDPKSAAGEPGSGMDERKQTRFARGAPSRSPATRTTPPSASRIRCAATSGLFPQPVVLSQNGRIWDGRGRSGRRLSFPGSGNGRPQRGAPVDPCVSGVAGGDSFRGERDHRATPRPERKLPHQ